MNTIFDLSPWSLLGELMGVDRRLGRVFRSAACRAEGRFPPVNVFVDENAVLVEAELPGKTAADVELTIEPQTLVLAEKPAKKEGETAAPAATWERRVELPFRVDADKANAAFKDGILRIELPKTDAAAPRRIAIATA